MTKEEWDRSEDAHDMLIFLWKQRGFTLRWPDVRFGGNVQQSDAEVAADNDFSRSLHRFYLESCRSIWKLLPQEESRRGVELAERFLAGAATAEEVNEYNWHVEAAAFCIDYDSAPEDIARWVAEVRALPVADLRAIVYPPEAADEVEPRELLMQAAYFVDYAMIYPSLRPQGPPPASYRVFLSAKLLRRHVGYPEQLGRKA